MRSLFISGGCPPRTNVSACTDALYFACSNSVVTCHSVYLLRGGNITFLHVRPDAIVIGDDIGNVSIMSEKKYTAQVGIGDACVAVEATSASCVVQQLGQNAVPERRCEMTRFKLSTKIYCAAIVDTTVFIFSSFTVSAVDACCSFVFVGDVFGFVRVYKNNKLVTETKAHDDSIRDIKATDTNGVFVSTASQDNLVKVWKLKRNSDEKYVLEKKDVLESHSDWVMSVQWAGTDLVSSSLDNSVLLWEKKSEKSEWVNAKRLGNLSEKNKAFYNAIPFNAKYTPKPNSLCTHRCADDTADSDAVVLCQSHSGGFYLYVNDKLQCSMSGHVGEIKSLDWNGDFLLTTGVDMTVRIFHAGKEVGRAMNHGHPITDARWIHKECLYPHLDAENMQNTAESLRGCADGGLTKAFTILVASQETILRVLEPTTLFLLNQGLQGGNAFTSINSELSLTAEDRDDGSLGINESSLSDNRFSEASKAYGHYFEVSALAVCENRIFSANRASDHKFSGIFVWDKLMKNLNYVKCHDLGINKLRTSVCGAYLLAASRDKSVSLYNITRGAGEIELIKRISDHKRSVFDCGFNYDSTLFASVSRDKRLLVYNFCLEMVYEKKYECESTCMSFSMTRNVVCVGLEDGDIDVVDLDSHTSQRIQAHGKGVAAVEFNQNDMLATGGLDGIVRIFGI